VPPSYILSTNQAKNQSYCDYGFHLILTNPTPEVIYDQFPILIEQGISTVKIYMSYEERRLSDDNILKVMVQTRRLGMTTLIHAENWDMISFIIDDLKKKELTDPYFHAVSRPPIVEDEASYRAICLSELLDTPILIVHVSTNGATRNIRNAQTKMLPIMGETCPQYLYLMSDKLKLPNFEGAKYVCSPPMRDDVKDIQALWDGIANGTFQVVNSDHCPFNYGGEGGKMLGIVNGIAKFTDIPNGLPGIETRVPLMFQGVNDGRITPQKFVEVTSYNPALLYGFEKKGLIAPGYDADIVIWYPQEAFQGLTITNGMLNHDIDYTPYEGIRVGNWPRYTILRGEVVWDRDNQGLTVKGPSGKFVKRTGNKLRGPRGQFSSEWHP
jgi:dihydropyrimidinase